MMKTAQRRDMFNSVGRLGAGRSQGCDQRKCVVSKMGVSPVFLFLHIFMQNLCMTSQSTSRYTLVIT